MGSESVLTRRVWCCRDSNVIVVIATLLLVNDIHPIAPSSLDGFKFMRGTMPSTIGALTEPMDCSDGNAVPSSALAADVRDPASSTSSSAPTDDACVAGREDARTPS